MHCDVSQPLFVLSQRIAGRPFAEMKDVLLAADRIRDRRSLGQG